MSAIAACALGCASGTEPEAGADVPGDMGPDASPGEQPRPDADTGAGTESDAGPVRADACDDDPCHPGVPCTPDAQAPGGYVCGPCPAGTEGDGARCTDIDGCAGSPCFPGVKCADVPAPGDGHECGPCPAGYEGDGVSCALLCEPAGVMQCPSQVLADSAGGGSADRIDQWACSSVSLTGPEIVYSFVPQQSGTVAAILDQLDADLDLVVVAASAGVCNPEDATVCAAESHRAGTTGEFTTWEATAGTTYYVIVDGYQGASSSFRLWLGTAASSIYLSEIEYYQPDFIELSSRSACTVDLAGLAVVHDPTYTAPIEYVIPEGTLVDPGGVVRLVEKDSGPYQANELDIGVLIDDDINGVGFTALCSGSCENDCSNLLDYVERDDDPSDGVTPAAPACASFSPGPVNTAATQPTGLIRVGHSGGPGDFRAADWDTGTTSRD